MIGNRIKIANRIARKRFKRGIWGTCGVGDFRKNNTVCSCEMCRNPRRCSFTPKKGRPTAQERRSPTIESFDNESDDFWFDDHYCDSYVERYWNDKENNID